MKAASLPHGLRHLLFCYLFAFVSTQPLCAGAGGVGQELFTGELNDDILGLIVFKSDLHDPNSALSSWNEDDDNPCSWAYVQCNPLTGRVTELSLHGLSLSGKLGRGLERLRGLEVLSLSHNRISGVVSPGIFLIPNLRRLNLSHNSLSGPIPPELGDMTSILSLDLSHNALFGPIPDGLFDGSSCTTLRFVSLAGNHLEGTIPSSLSKCSFLLGLDLSGNRLSGSPDFSGSIYTMKRLRTLDLSHNSFSGIVPEGAAVLHNLKVLNLNGNGFSGQLPTGIGLCPHLMSLDLSSNSFAGALPYTLQRLLSLSLFNLSGNQFSGDLPRWVSNMSTLQLLDFSSNRFTGGLPPSMGDLKQLNYLSLSYNNLTGEIPASLAECTELKEIRLKGNYLNGSIPPRLFDLGLEEIDLSSNDLAGSMPAGSTRLFESLHVLDLSENRLTGVIPAEMALYFNLRHLNLSCNDLRSRLPPELGEFRNLSVVDLRNNELHGSIPADFCISDSLAVLQLDGNFLTGPIPEEIGNCSSLYLLSLSNNSLSGSIPCAMSKLKKLKILNLEYNDLSGEIPREMSELDNLLAVNISHNRLIGRLPTGGIFQSLDKSSLQGNLGICSPLVTEPCMMNVPKPLVLDPNAYNKGNGDTMVSSRSSSSSKSRHRRFLSVSALVAISAALVIVLGVMVVSLLNISVRRKLGLIDNALESMCSSSSKSGGPAVGRLVLFGPRGSLRSGDMAGDAETLLQKATEIGRGVFGTVYKTSIGEGRILAIKKLLTPNIIEYHDDFDREVRVLGKARHPNLMALKGYYWTPQLQLLISDYAPGGSLHTRLHENTETRTPLSWANRFKIALGTAKGLAHLHQSFRPPIIHYNIKPSNILLDENCDPKVSDFGLARLLPKLDKHMLSGRFHGALGYMAPELSCQSLRINEKCDVYGFGVLVLELVTGRQPVEYGEDDVVILIDQVRVLLEQGNVLDCIDQRMGAFPEEEVLPVLKLGLVCTSQVPSSRPSMSEVVHILQVIKAPIPERMEVF